MPLVAPDADTAKGGRATAGRHVSVDVREGETMTTVVIRVATWLISAGIVSICYPTMAQYWQLWLRPSPQALAAELDQAVDQPSEQRKRLVRNVLRSERRLLWTLWVGALMAMVLVFVLAYLAVGKLAKDGTGRALIVVVIVVAASVTARGLVWLIAQWLPSRRRPVTAMAGLLHTLTHQAPNPHVSLAFGLVYPLRIYANAAVNGLRNRVDDQAALHHLAIASPTMPMAQVRASVAIGLDSHMGD